MTHQMTYRKVNVACSNMNLSSSTIDVPTFRAILRCLNANQALDPIEQLFLSVTDEQLKPWVDFSNRALLNHKKRLYEVGVSYKALAADGVIDALFKKIGAFLGHTDLILGLVASFRAALCDPKTGKIDSEFLRFTESVAQHLLQDSWVSALELGIRLTGAPAFEGLKGNLQKRNTDLPDTHSLSLFQKNFSQFFEYFQKEHPISHGHSVSSLGSFVEKAIQKGYFFEALDQIFHISQRPLLAGQDQPLKQEISELSELFKVMTQPLEDATSGSYLKSKGLFIHSTPLERLSFALQALKGKKVSCLKAAQDIDSIDLYLLSEIGHHTTDATQYILKTEPLSLMALRPFCEFPNDLQEHYESLIQIAEAGVMPALARAIRILNEAQDFVHNTATHDFQNAINPRTLGKVTQTKKSTSLGSSKPGPFTRRILDWLVDPYIGQGNCQGVGCIVPVLQMLTTQGAWENLLLLLSSFNQEDFQLIKKFAQWMVHSAGDEKRPVEFFYRMFSRVDLKNALQFAVGARSFLLDEKQFTKNFSNSFLMLLHRAYLGQSGHPFLSLIEETLSHARQNESFFHSIFLLAQQPQFVEALTLTSQMAQDGRLKQLVETVIQMFQKFAASGKSLSAEKVIPSRLPLSAPLHQLSASDLSFHRSPQQMHPACRALDWNFSFANVEDPHFPEQMRAFADCLNSESNQSQAAKGIYFLIEEKACFKTQVDFLKGFVHGPYSLAKSDIRYLLNHWTESVDQGTFFDFLHVAHIMMTGPPISYPDQSSGSLLKPLLGLLDSLFVRAQTHWTYLEKVAAKWLKSEHFLTGIAVLWDSMRISSSIQQMSPGLPIQEDQEGAGRGWIQELSQMEHWIVDQNPYYPDLFERIRAWVRGSECAIIPVDSEHGVEERVKSVIHEAWSNYTNDDLPSSGLPRKSWTLDELKKILNPVFQKMVDPTLSDPARPLVEAFLNFFKYFRWPKRGSHYPPEYLYQWLKERSIDYRLITYYYPGEEHPRVRLVNSLDRFELLISNVDFVAPFPPFKNMALDFLQEIAEAWGDVTERNEWPQEIQAKFPSGTRPMTLAEAVKDIIARAHPGENLDFLIKSLGFPAKNACAHSILGEKEVPRRLPSGSWLPVPPELRRDYRSRLYNLKQIHSVLVENASRGTDGSPAGLEVFRDIFFELFYASPAHVKKAWAPASYGKTNHLTVVVEFVRLGFLRQLSRLVQEVEASQRIQNDFFFKRTLDEFFRFIAHLSELKMTKNVIMGALCGGPCPSSRPWDKSSQKLDFGFFWNVMKQFFVMIDQEYQAKKESLSFGEERGVRGMRNLQNSRKLQNAKDMAFYLPALFDQFDPLETASQRRGMTVSLLKTTQQILAHYGSFLGSQDSLFQDLFASDGMVDFLKQSVRDPDVARKSHMRPFLEFILHEAAQGAGIHAMALLQDIYEQPVLKQKWDAFWLNGSAFLQSGVLQKWQGTAPIPLPRALSGPAQEVADKLRFSLADGLEQGVFHPLLQASYQNRDGFYSILEAISHALGENGAGELEDFFKMLRRSLSPQEN